MWLENGKLIFSEDTKNLSNSLKLAIVNVCNFMHITVLQAKEDSKIK